MQTRERVCGTRRASRKRLSRRLLPPPHAGRAASGGFQDLAGARPGLDLDVMEEAFIRSEGGLDVLQNLRHQMSAGRFVDGTNSLLRGYQGQMAWQSGLLNGGFGAAENFSRK